MECGCSLEKSANASIGKWRQSRGALSINLTMGLITFFKSSYTCKKSSNFSFLTYLTSVLSAINCTESWWISEIAVAANETTFKT